MKKLVKLLILIWLAILNIFIITGCTKAKASSKNDNVINPKHKAVESRKDYIELIREFETKSQQVIKNYEGLTYKVNSYILSEDNVFIGFFDKGDKEIPFLYINFDHKEELIKIELKFNPIKKCDKREKICEEKEKLFYDLIKNCFNDDVSKESIEKRLDKIRQENGSKTIKFRVTTDNDSKVEIGYEDNELISLYYNFSEEIKSKNEELINDVVIKGNENEVDYYVNNKLKKVAQLSGGKDSDIKVTLNDSLANNEIEKRRYGYFNNKDFGYEYKFIKLNINNKEFVQNVTNFNFVVDKGQILDYEKSILYESIKTLYNEEINNIISIELRKVNNGEINSSEGLGNRYKKEVYNSDLNIIINIDISKYDNNDSYRISILKWVYYQIEALWLLFLF